MSRSVSPKQFIDNARYTRTPSIGPGPYLDRVMKLSFDEWYEKIGKFWLPNLAKAVQKKFWLIAQENK